MDTYIRTRKTYKLGNKDLCSYCGVFDGGEEQAIINLLAKENNCKSSDIELIIIKEEVEII